MFCLVSICYFLIFQGVQPLANSLRLRYYSDIYVANNKGSDKVLCAWMDGNGDQPITGIQVHWPDYDAGFKGNGNNADL